MTPTPSTKRKKKVRRSAAAEEWRALPAEVRRETLRSIANDERWEREAAGREAHHGYAAAAESCYTRAIAFRAALRVLREAAHG